MKIVRKRVPAPEWFIKAIEEADEIGQTAFNIIGYDVSWGKQNPEAAARMFSDIENKVMRRKAYHTLAYSSQVAELAWAKYRLENDVEEENLRFDSDTKEIIHKVGAGDVIRDGMKSIASGLKDIFDGNPTMTAKIQGLEETIEENEHD